MIETNKQTNQNQRKKSKHTKFVVGYGTGSIDDGTDEIQLNNELNE